VIPATKIPEAARAAGRSPRPTFNGTIIETGTRSYRLAPPWQLS
jgi:hypothetical protein